MVRQRIDFPGVNTVRESIHSKERIRQFLPGLMSFTLPLLVWLASLFGIVLSPWWAKIPLGIVNGFAIGVMFIIGHDACHGILFPRRWMNRLAGRISLMPALHPYAAWVHNHNGLHHAFTNIREKDPGFPPMDIAEYGKMSYWSRFSYRLGRTWYGLGWLYFREMWMKWEFFPSKARYPKNRKAFARDRIQIVVFVALWIGVLVWGALESNENIFLMIGVGFVLPQFIWNWLIGFIILQQHTHPRVAWYSELDLPSPMFFQAQLHATPHLIFPFLFRFIMRHVMEHTAHHADPAVPLYSLSNAQKSLEHSYRRDIVRVVWTPRGFLKTLNTCKLYDYTNHCWTDYEGKPTTECLYEKLSPAWSDS